MRELENLIERAVVLTRDDVIGSSDLSLTVRDPEVDGDRGTNLTVAVEALERHMIKEALARSDGVQTQAADLLGISERGLRYKLIKYGFRKIFRARFLSCLLDCFPLTSIHQRRRETLPISSQT